MLKKYLIIIILIVVVGISGCTTKTATNGTFGEKSISISDLIEANNTTADHYIDNGIQYYYIDGYIKNNNNYDVFNVKFNAIAYDANGNVVATNDTAYLNTIPSKGITEFYIDFPDPNSKIVRYDLKIVNATSIL